MSLDQGPILAIVDELTFATTSPTVETILAEAIQLFKCLPVLSSSSLLEHSRQGKVDLSRALSILCILQR